MNHYNLNFVSKLYFPLIELLDFDYLNTPEIRCEVYFLNFSKKIFDHSLKIMKINTENCVFVGDQIDTDIIGAQNANIKPILIDREDLYPEYEDCLVINNLNELLDVINL